MFITQVVTIAYTQHSLEGCRNTAVPAHIAVKPPRKTHKARGGKTQKHQTLHAHPRRRRSAVEEGDKSPSNPEPERRHRSRSRFVSRRSSPPLADPKHWGASAGDPPHARQSSTPSSPSDHDGGDHRSRTPQTANPALSQPSSRTGQHRASARSPVHISPIFADDAGVDNTREGAGWGDQNLLMWPPPPRQPHLSRRCLPSRTPARQNLTSPPKQSGRNLPQRLLDSIL